MALCESALSCTSYDLPGDFLSVDRFHEVLKTLNNQASPGLPYTAEAPTIGEWLKFDGLKYDPQQVARLWVDTQLVLAGDWDPIFRVFVKQEAHKKAKAEEGRWRVIMGFPLPLQCAWKMLFDYGNSKFLEKSFDIPIQHGFKLPQGVWRQYYTQWKSFGYNTSTDISAYDMSITWLWIKMALDIRYRLTKGPYREQWYKIALRLYEMAFHHPLLQFSTGELVRLMLLAIQKSGSPNTIGDNGIIRLLKWLYICIVHGVPVYPLGSYVGDDGLQYIPEHIIPFLVEWFKEVGLTLKCVDRGMEFVGHRHGAEGPQPTYVGKHLWNVQYQPSHQVPEFLDSMARLYAKSPMVHFWIELAGELGIRLLSPQYYRTWYDVEGEEFANIASLLGRYM